MAKNKIQFQPGLSVINFQKLYGSQQQCEQALFRHRWPNGFVCPRCGYDHYCKLKTRPVFQCSRCRHQCSLISGTIFASTKIPLPVWFWAIYFVTQSKDGISSLNLARSIGVSANTALRIKHKLQQVMKDTDDSLVLSETVQVDDAYWGGKKHDGVRGRGATGKTPIVAAISTTLQGHPMYMRLSRVSSFTSAEIGDWAQKHLCHNSLVLTDGMPGFKGIKHAGIFHKSIVTGGGYESVTIEAFKWVNTMLGNVKRSLHGSYHSISQKHIPRYLAEFCFRFNRRFFMPAMIPILVRAAVSSKPIPQHKLKLAEDWW